MLWVRAARTSSRARCRAEIPGEAIARSKVASDSADIPACIRHWASVHCKSTRRSGSTAYSSARPATCSAVTGITRTVEGIGESARQPAMPVPSPAGNRLRPGSGVRPRLRGPGRPAGPRCGPASRASTRRSAQLGRRRRPAAVAGPRDPAVRPPPPGRARRRDARPRVPSAGISSYSAARISGCRNPRPWPDSASTPTAHASSTAGIRSATLRPSTMARSEHREVRAEQGRRLQHFAHRTGHEANAIGYEPRTGSPARNRWPLRRHRTR